MAIVGFWYMLYKRVQPQSSMGFSALCALVGFGIDIKDLSGMRHGLNILQSKGLLLFELALK